MKGTKVVLLVALVAGLAPVRAFGETVPSLRPGLRVRVSTAPQAASPDWTTGTIVAVTSDRLAIQAQPDSGREIEIARFAVTRLEVSRGEHSRWLKGLGLGFLVGACAGAAIGSATLGEALDLNGTGAAAAGGVLGAPVGALVGVLIGAGSRSERWREIPITVSGMGGGQTSGYAVRVTVGFPTR